MSDWLLVSVWVGWCVLVALARGLNRSSVCLGNILLLVFLSSGLVSLTPPRQRIIACVCVCVVHICGCALFQSEFVLCGEESFPNEAKMIRLFLARELGNVSIIESRVYT